MTIFRTTLGTAKGATRSRIWIEGVRLSDAGFEPGTLYTLDTELGNEHGPVWRISTTSHRAGEPKPKAMRVVSGKGAKPIIDITGKAVADTFGGLCTHVICHFMLGCIEIQGDVGQVVED